jgi:diguanylate cyclase (GGDEF)-like protein
MALGSVIAPLEGEKTPDRHLLAQLLQCANLPSPVGVVMRILELGENPEAGVSEVCQVLTADPALSARLIRMANSPLYARQRRTSNLRQAIKLFGVEGTITLALSFSLVTNLRNHEKGGFDYGRFWHRSFAAAVCAQVAADRFGLRNREELFLAGLLQDIGMLTLARARPEIYAGLDAPHWNHRHVLAREEELLGTNHAVLGALLLQQWNFPSRLQRLVASSHDEDDAETLRERDAAIVAISSDMAEIWSEPNGQAVLRRAMSRAEQLLGLEADGFIEVLELAGGAISEVAPLFDIEIEDSMMLETIVTRARELTMLRHIRIMQHAAILEDRTRRLEEENRRDSLTGVFNRGYLQACLAREMESAAENGWPVALVFVDLDRFKAVNDKYGHLAGDGVLCRVADVLQSAVRRDDIVARYGGEEFVLLMPGCGDYAVRASCNRLLEALRKISHEVGEGQEITVTASIGVAVHNEDHRFKDAEDLIGAADAALYVAKTQGRNRCIFHKDLP